MMLRYVLQHSTRSNLKRAIAIWFFLTTLFLLFAHHTLSIFEREKAPLLQEPSSLRDSQDLAAWHPVQPTPPSTSSSQTVTSSPSGFPQVLSMANFTVLSTIGKGSFGSVKLARYQHDGREFAIKHVLKANMPDVLIYSITQERAIMQLIQHPYISSLAFAFQDDTFLYFGMEYYPGGSLQFHMTQGPLPRPDVTLYAAELVLALSHIHAHNIIFRDLKPGNIMLDQDGHLRLVDFGISLQNITSCCHGVSNFAGTLPYMAPESFAKWPPHDARQYGKSFDWWSVGIIMYEMLAGENPFVATDAEMKHLIPRILNSPIEYPTSQFDTDAADLIRQFLNRDPHRRLGAALAQGDFASIQAHPFFKSIDWEALEARQVDAPWKPTLNCKDKLRYVSKELDVQDEVLHFTGFNLALPPLSKATPPLMKIGTHSCHVLH